MLGFLVAGLHPVIVKAGWKSNLGKARDDVPMQIHGVQFDMRHRVQQGDAALGRSGPTTRHVTRISQIGFFGARRAQWRRGGANGDLGAAAVARCPPCGGMFVGKCGLSAAISSAQHRDGHLGERLGHGRVASTERVGRPIAVSHLRKRAGRLSPDQDVMTREPRPPREPPRRGLSPSPWATLRRFCRHGR